MPIESIKIGERHRKDMGNIGELAESIKAVGLLHPVVLRQDHTLVAGARRIEAARVLEWDTIPTRIVRDIQDELQTLRAEQDENTCRKDFAPSEAVAMKDSILGRLKQEAKDRQHSAGSRGNEGGRGNKKQNPSADSAEGFSKPKGDTRDRVAGAVGMGRDKLEKATAVVEAAKEDPEKFAGLVDEMDRTGNVNGAYRKLQEEKTPAPPPPRHPYSDMLLDWIEKIASQPAYIDLELGGLSEILKERKKWDWQKMDTYILPMLDEFSKLLGTYRKEIGNAIKQS